MVRSLALLPLLSGLFSPVIALSRNPIQVQEPNQAQTQGHAAFPSCAVNCSLLQQAQRECADNEHATIASCFCQSSLIDRLHSGPDGVCDQVCTASDRALLHAWYGKYCSKNTKRDSVSTLETPLEDTEMAPSQNFSTLKPRGGGDWYVTFQNNTDRRLITMRAIGGRLTTNGLSWSSSSSSASPSSPS